jgi:hypothetical protein
MLCNLSKHNTTYTIQIQTLRLNLQRIMLLPERQVISYDAKLSIACAGPRGSVDDGIAWVARGIQTIPNGM